MTAPTKVLHFSDDEVRDRIQMALNIMEALNVDEIRWEAVFNNVCMMLGAHSLQYAQQVPVALPDLRGRH